MPGYLAHLSDHKEPANDGLCETGRHRSWTAAGEQLCGEPRCSFVLEARMRICKTNYWRRKMANGWASERRAKQAKLIRQWRPWERATGPRTVEGKAVSRRNAYQG